MAPRLRILLIQPAWDGLLYRRKIKVDERAIHPLSLGVVAALSGPHDVRIVDEARENVPDSARAFDVVGISVNTFNAPQAYGLADRFRTEGVPVVFGGPHVALLPDECQQHADSIVVGDAEDTWPQALQDILDHRLQPRYRSPGPNGTPMPAPRRDLFHRSSRHVAYCQLSRGCTNKCRFCYLQYQPHATMRLRQVGSVVDELRSLPQEIILFVDDNVFCECAYTKELFQAITPLRKRWWIQAPTNIHEDDDLITLMAESGCYAVSVGFQTVSNLTNQNERILQNRVEDYAVLVQRLHHEGILVDGTFILGFDSDDRGTFDATAEMIKQLGLDTYTFYFLTPYPGTEYFAQFEREGRILHRDWSKFDWDHVVVQPKQMSVDELRNGVKNLYQKLDRSHFLQNAVRRLARQRRNCSSLTLLSFLASTGWHYYRSPILRE